MSVDDTSVATQRVAFLSDSGRADVESLALLRRIAAPLHAELVVQFIESVELLRAAALPFNREIGLISGAVRAMDVGAVERSLRRQADQLRQQLAAIANDLQLPWSFDISRGTLIEHVASQVMTASVVVVGARRQARLSVLSSSILGARTVLAMYEPGQVGERAVATAWNLAQHKIENFKLLIVESSESVAENLRKAIARGFGVAPQAMNTLRYTGPLREIGNQLFMSGVQAVVMPMTRVSKKREELGALLRTLDRAVVLVA
ncbi:MAG: hypothetical protein U1F34_07450 [Gammaproteobacteria bacterium]